MNRYRKVRLFKRIFVAFLAIGFFFSLSAFALYKTKPKTFNKYKSKLVSYLDSSEKPTSLSLDYEDVAPDLTPVYSKSSVKRNLIVLHRIAAGKNGVKKIESKEDLEALIKSKELVSVQNGIGYKLGIMTHSYAYLTPNAKIALQKIGISFHHFSKNNSYFTVSSLTRTEETQKKLQKSNRNATKEESTHCRGVSFDISYIRYNGTREWNDKLTRVLEGVLAAMQESNEIYVVKESKQSCFHITVRD